MSDEIKKAEMTSEEAFSEEIKRRLAEPDSGKPSLEEFKLMVYKDRERRRKRRNAAVAGIVVALLAGFFAFDTLVPEVGADKNPKEEIITEDGVIIEDGGYGSSVGEDDVFVINDWEHVIDGKMVTQKLLIPQYIPNGYMFEKLVIESVVEEDILCKYYFSDEKNNNLIIEIFITEGETTYAIEDVSKRVETPSGTIYWQQQEKKATIILDGSCMVSVWSDLSENETMKIIEGLCA